MNYKKTVIKNPPKELAHLQAVQTLRRSDDLDLRRNDPSVYLEGMINLMLKKGLIVKLISLLFTYGFEFFNSFRSQFDCY